MAVLRRATIVRSSSSSTVASGRAPRAAPSRPSSFRGLPRRERRARNGYLGNVLKSLLRDPTGRRRTGSISSASILRVKSTLDALYLQGRHRTRRVHPGRSTASRQDPRSTDTRRMLSSRPEPQRIQLPSMWLEGSPLASLLRCLARHHQGEEALQHVRRRRKQEDRRACEARRRQSSARPGGRRRHPPRRAVP